jgi:hypothetical protein
VSAEAHEQLLQYLAANRDIYWVDSYINIMKVARFGIRPFSEVPAVSTPEQASSN